MGHGSLNWYKCSQPVGLFQVPYPWWTPTGRHQHSSSCIVLSACKAGMGECVWVSVHTRVQTSFLVGWNNNFRIEKKAIWIPWGILEGLKPLYTQNTPKHPCDSLLGAPWGKIMSGEFAFPGQQHWSRGQDLHCWHHFCLQLSLSATFLSCRQTQNHQETSCKYLGCNRGWKRNHGPQSFILKR